MSKPLKLKEGKIKEFDNNDELPNQPDIDDLRTIVALMILEMEEMGIHFKDPRILNLLNEL